MQPVAAHGAYQPMVAPVQCCCCNARTGLRVLGWWWLIDMILNVYTFFLPVFWVAGITVFASLLVPFIVFIKMT